MSALKFFVGLAIVTAVAPIVVLIGSSPAHADPRMWDTCSSEGAKTWTPQDGGLVCQNMGSDPVRGGSMLQWMRDDEVYVHCSVVADCRIPHP